MTHWRDYIRGAEARDLQTVEREIDRCNHEKRYWSSMLSSIRNRCTLRQRRAAQSDGGKGE